MTLSLVTLYCVVISFYELPQVLCGISVIIVIEKGRTLKVFVLNEVLS